VVAKLRGGTPIPLPKQKQQSQNQTAREMMLSLSFQVSTEADSKSRMASAPEESTLDTGRIVAELKRGRDRLSKAIAALDGLSPQPQSAAKDERCSQASHSQHKKGFSLPGARREGISPKQTRRASSDEALPSIPKAPVSF
jgi:hypothetical protein